MGTLPDLETQTAGHAAFYNLIEQAGLTQQSLTWSDVVNNGNLTDYKAFDNGVILDYSDDAFGTIKIRCKTDGWVVAYTGWDGSVNADSGSLATNSGSCLTYHDIDSTNSISNNRLVNAMEDIMSDLSDWNLANYSSSGVGIYDFAYGSDGISHFFERVSGKGSTATRVASKTSTTTIGAVHISGHANGTKNGELNSKPATVYVDGSTLVSEGGRYDDVKHAHTDANTSMDQNGQVEVELHLQDLEHTPLSTTEAGAALTAYWSDQ